MKRKLKRGLVIRHTRLNKRGIVIDWGLLSSKHREYEIASRERAEAVRVWTKSQIEIWPLKEIDAI